MVVQVCRLLDANVFLDTWSEIVSRYKLFHNLEVAIACVDSTACLFGDPSASKTKIHRRSGPMHDIETTECFLPYQKACLSCSVFVKQIFVVFDVTVVTCDGSYCTFHLGIFAGTCFSNGMDRRGLNSCKCRHTRPSTTCWLCCLTFLI